MAIKTFTTGEVLTAADTNTYLANSGLVLVTSATVGSGVSSVTVANCFNSTYDNYIITLNGGTASVSNASIKCQLGPTSVSNYNTGYYGFLVYGAYTGSTVSGAGLNNGSSWNWIGGMNGANGAYARFELQGPNLALWTRMMSQGYDGTSNSGALAGTHQYTNQYTGCTISPETGTLTGGVVTVYGYRKA
jgi:hypothetical protein